jgi:hypothetical protein
MYFLLNGAEELVASDLPSMKIDTGLALSYNMRLKCPVQPDRHGLMVTARLVLDAASK